MTPMKTIIVDDEPDCIQVLDMMLQATCPEVKVIAHCGSAPDAVQKITALDPDLVFLDIEMPDKSGFDMLKNFANARFEVVIVTGYEHYALRAIKFAAIDFLLKPFSVPELKMAVDRAGNMRSRKNTRLTFLSDLLSDGIDHEAEKLMIHSNDGFLVVKLSDIISIVTESGNYCTFHLSGNKRCVVTKPLSYFEELLPKDMFCRIHRSHMVNVLKLVSFNNKQGIVQMEDESEYEVSHRRRAEFYALVKHLRI